MTKEFLLEQHVDLNQAASYFPGRRPSLSTLHRWADKGVRGIRLESLRVGSRRYTSKAAVDRFVRALNQTDDDRLRAQGC